MRNKNRKRVDEKEENSRGRNKRKGVISQEVNKERKEETARKIKKGICERFTHRHK
jgi:hypothetical protein